MLRLTLEITLEMWGAPSGVTLESYIASMLWWRDNEVRWFALPCEDENRIRHHFRRSSLDVSDEPNSNYDEQPNHWCGEVNIMIFVESKSILALLSDKNVVCEVNVSFSLSICSFVFVLNDVFFPILILQFIIILRSKSYEHKKSLEVKWHVKCYFSPRKVMLL